MKATVVTGAVTPGFDEYRNSSTDEVLPAQERVVHHGQSTPN
jgi:hypothetical protein